MNLQVEVNRYETPAKLPTIASIGSGVGSSVVASNNSSLAHPKVEDDHFRAGPNFMTTPEEAKKEEPLPPPP